VSNKLWGGRFSKDTNLLVRRLNDSLPFDQRLWKEDIRASVAWAHALAQAGLLTSAECAQLVAGLELVRAEFAAGSFMFAVGDEDIHTAVERRLTELVGSVGGKLHTGRSRNDQVATDLRLWMMQACEDLAHEISGLQAALIDSAASHLYAIMPGYTHLQQAQPVTWGHWALSHFWPLVRDAARLANARSAAGVLPLGSGALAGTAFVVDRDALARSLGFEFVSTNSMDAVSDRDFVCDFLYAGTMIGVHLSRLAEQLLLFSSAEFGYVVVDDAYSTGSSLMPQKKNADPLELARGKTGRLFGNLQTLLVVLKGLPSTYDKDLQEDKEPAFDTFDTLLALLPVMAGLVRSLQVRPQAMAARLLPGLLATDMADELVRQGVPFREAHGLVGALVQRAEGLGVELTKVSLAERQRISAHFTDEMWAEINFEHSLQRRGQIGGTAHAAVEAQLLAARAALRVDNS
jgi:argininosuccinate lyase